MSEQPPSDPLCHVCKRPGGEHDENEGPIISHFFEPAAAVKCNRYCAAFPNCECGGQPASETPCKGCGEPTANSTGYCRDCYADTAGGTVTSNPQLPPENYRVLWERDSKALGVMIGERNMHRAVAEDRRAEIERLRADALRLNKLEWMSMRYKVSIVDTGVLPYRVCLNGQVLANSLREAIDKCIDAARAADDVTASAATVVPPRERVIHDCICKNRCERKGGKFPDGWPWHCKGLPSEGT